MNVHHAGQQASEKIGKALTAFLFQFSGCKQGQV